MKIDQSLLQKYNKPGPRYTSYPPANFFTTDITPAEYRDQLSASNSAHPQSISLYVHVPFCNQLCHFCGCNTQLLQGGDRIAEYFAAVNLEIVNASVLIAPGRTVTQVHWGGGTPNAVPMEYISRTMALLRQVFAFAPDAEIAMECNPAYLDEQQIESIGMMGFNRISIGVQDFDTDVLKTINREPSLLPVGQLMALLRQTGIQGINMDFVYGLPGQTVDSFCKSINTAIGLNPDRLVTFSYAHVPWVKSAQKILERLHLPTAHEKLSMLEASSQLLIQHGYASIGIDHYAKPEDELSQAQREKSLHRNFQGYCTLEKTGQVYAFGCSAISQLDGGYFQNHKSTADYIRTVTDAGFATERGYLLSRTDRIVRDIINQIMCNHYVNFQGIADSLGIASSELLQICKFDRDKMDELEADGLAVFDGCALEVLPAGYYFTRNVAMLFDPQLAESENTYSKTI
jgi:oxygen-independent coproporphyrinogen III oxidase